MCRSRVLSEGVQLNSDKVFFFNLVYEGRERIQISLKASHHRPASKMPFKWLFAGGQVMAQQL